jgi:hypothetical protein
MIEPSIFNVATTIGFTVRTNQTHWDLIQRKHPEVADKLDDIIRCLQEPSVILRSNHDLAVYLFYRPVEGYYLAVVARRLNGDGFVITSYLTDAIKEGEQLWPTSE